jgi:hypothetical protein
MIDIKVKDGLYIITAPKPLAAACPLCARELQILSAAPIPPTPEASA